MKALKITSTILYSLFLCVLIFFFAWTAHDVLTTEDGWAKVGGVIVLVVTLIGSLAFLIPAILSIIGLCITRRAEKSELPFDSGRSYKRSKAHFSILILISFLTPLLNVLAYIILLKN
jgi:hypothetical protein